MFWNFKKKKKNTFPKTKKTLSDKNTFERKSFLKQKILLTRQKIDFEGKKIDFKLEGEIVYFVNLHINFNIFKLEVK